MKKRFLFIVTTAITAIALSSCQLFKNVFNESSYEESSNHQKVASSKEPISDVSTPPADDITATRASMDYTDFIENNAYSLSSTPSIGTANILVIPVWFTDSNKYIKDANKDAVRQDIHDAYFGSAASVGWHSVKSYYETESFGALTLTGIVSEWYEPNKSVSYYANDPASETAGVPKTTSLVKNAVNWYFSNHSSDTRTNYDHDNDGYLDGVMLIYAAPDYGTLNNDNYDNLWAYCYWVQDYSVQNPSNPGVNAFFWASYDFMYGEEVASSRSGNRYHAGDTSHCTVDAHTYIHEMGHMFGLEDYYDYSNHSYVPGGGFSMQDFNVGGHDPFSSFALGWGKAYIPSDTATIDLHPFATSGEMILLSPNWNSYNSPFDEYILLEYYTDLGLNELDSTYGYMSQYGKDYPMGTKDYGIRVWHVDARLLYTVTGEFSASMITTNPRITSGRVVLLASNTYNDGTEETSYYLSPLADQNSKYASFNILQQIRNDKKSTYKPKDLLSSSTLFKRGDTFQMSDFSKQFVNSSKLNNNLDLGFKFTVNACNNDKASITVTKL